MAKEVVQAEIGLELNPKLTKVSANKLRKTIKDSITQLSKVPTPEVQKASAELAKTYRTILNSADKVLKQETVQRGRRKGEKVQKTDLLQSLVPSGEDFPKELKGFAKTTRSQFLQLANVYKTAGEELNKSVIANADSIQRGESFLDRYAKATPKKRVKLLAQKGVQEDIANFQAFTKEALKRQGGITKSLGSREILSADDKTFLDTSVGGIAFTDAKDKRKLQKRLQTADEFGRDVRAQKKRELDRQRGIDRETDLYAQTRKAKAPLNTAFEELDKITSPSAKRRELRKPGAQTRIDTDRAKIKERIATVTALKKSYQELEKVTGKSFSKELTGLRDLNVGLGQQARGLQQLGSEKTRQAKLDTQVNAATLRRDKANKARHKNSIERQKELRIQTEKTAQTLSRLRVNQAKVAEAASGGRALDRAGGDFYKVAPEKQVSANAYLSRQKEFLEAQRQVLLSQRGATPGSALKLEGVEKDLVRVNTQLGKSKERLKAVSGGMTNFGKVSEFAGRTLRQFFRYAIGYGALYQVLGAVKGLTGGLVGLDASLKSIQAVSRATDKDMSKIEATIKSVAVTTKFGIDEIAQSAQVLAQAGVSPEEQDTALKAVAQFAAATNSTLQVSADLISTMRNVYTDLSDGSIADQLTKAVNISKLTAEDLSTILSRGLQVSKAYNISSEQFLSAVTVLRNAGIKASTVSTGLRQTVLELMSPDKKTVDVLVQRYAELGENLSSEQVQDKFFQFRQSENPLQSVIEEFKRLGASGSASKLFSRVIDTRAENVFKVLTKNVDQLNDSLARIGDPGASAEGSKTQLESLRGSAQNLGAVITGLADTLSGTLVGSLAEATTYLTEFLKKVDEGLEKSNVKGGASGGFIASLAAGATAAVKTRGGFLKKGAAALGAAGVTSAATTGAEASGGKLAGEVVNAIIALGSTLALFLGKGFGKDAGGVKGITASTTKLGGLVGVFKAGFSLHPLGKLLSVVVTAATLVTSFKDYIPGLNKLFGEGIEGKISAAQSLLAKSQSELAGIEEALEDYDLDKAESTEGTLKGLQEVIEGFSDNINAVLGDLVEGQTQAARDELVKSLSGLEAGSLAARNVLSQLGLGTGEADANRAAELSGIATTRTGADTQAKALREEAVNYAVRNLGAEGLSPADAAKVEALSSRLSALGVDASTEEILQTLREVGAEVVTSLERDAESTKGVVERRQDTVTRLESAGIDTFEELTAYIAAVKESAAEKGNVVEIEEAIATLQQRETGIRSRGEGFFGQFRLPSSGVQDLSDLTYVAQQQQAQEAALEIAKAAVTEANKELRKTGDTGIAEFTELTSEGGQLSRYLKNLQVPEESARFTKADEDGRIQLTREFRKFLEDVQKAIKSDQAAKAQTTAEKKRKVEGFTYIPEADVETEINRLSRDIKKAKEQGKFPSVLEEGGLLQQKQKLQRGQVTREISATEEVRGFAKDIGDTKRKDKFDRKLVKLRDKQGVLEGTQEDETRKELQEVAERLLEIRKKNLELVKKGLELEKPEDYEEDVLVLNNLLADNTKEQALLSSDTTEALEGMLAEYGAIEGYAKIQAEQAEKGAEAQKYKNTQDEQIAGYNRRLLKLKEDEVKASELSGEQKYRLSLGGALTEEEQRSSLEGQLTAAEATKDEIQTQQGLKPTDVGLQKDLRGAKDQVENLQVQLDSLDPTILDLAYAKLTDAQDKLVEWKDVMTQGLTDSIGALSGSLVDMAATGDESFTKMRDSARRFFADLSKQIAKAALQEAILSGIGSFGGKNGPASGLLGLFSKAKTGGVVSNGDVQTSFSSGGIIKGPGTGTSDSVPGVVMEGGRAIRPIAVSNGEAILNAKLVKQLGAGTIHRANQQALRGFSSGGVVGMKSSNGINDIASKISDSVQPSQQPGLRVINAWDSGVIKDYMDSSEGERVVINSIQNNPDVVRELLEKR